MFTLLRYDDYDSAQQLCTNFQLSNVNYNKMHYLFSIQVDQAFNSTANLLGI